MFDDLRGSYKLAVLKALGPDAAEHATWTKSAVPTIKNTDDVIPLMRDCRSDDVRATRLSLSLRSPLDGLHGNWEATLGKHARRVQPSIEAKSNAFAEVMAPLGSAPATRDKAWRNWRTVVTWAVANKALDKILPMDQSTLQALLWDLTSLGAAFATLKSVVDAIIGQHRHSRLQSPVGGHLCYGKIKSILQRVLGKPHAHKLGVTRDMVVRLLRTNPTNILDLRNKLACCTMTIGIMRPVEGSLAQTCDYEQDSDRNKGLTQFDGGSTLRTLFRKNDQIRKGHEMRFGKSAHPDLDINFQLGLLMDLLGTRPRPGCTKSTRPGRRCPVCPPLFPKLQLDASGKHVLADDPTPTAALMSAMVVSALKTIGIHNPAFTGMSCRMGGLTVATEAGVPESILWMQSGHAQDRAARRYVRLTDPDRLYDTWRAFKL